MQEQLPIQIPEDLRKLPLNGLTVLSEQIRSFLIDHVAENGGHFSSSLGVVELTIALHYVFDTPVDKLVWDVGHQAYVHKLLTGRKNFFYSNRQLGGISGFPCREESEFDAFGTGHSSTSIAAALGMAIAARHKKNNKRQHIAVIGDGAMTAGLAFEALNNVGFEQPSMLIILNDNNMSIDNNVGALQNYLTKLTTGEQYNALKSQVKKAFSILPSAKWSIDLLRKLEKAIKGGVLQYSNLFEALNIRYFGPIDGHDIEKLVHTLEKLKHISGPKILHCITTKGNGYLPAMQEKEKWHAPGKFDKQTGITLSQKPNSDDTVTFQEIFGNTLIELAKANPNIVAVTPAMLSGSALTKMKKEMPDRVFDVGIAEQHAVTFSAGLATDGLRPFCTIYSTFLQRAYDQIIHDVALQKLDVVLCIDRAGVVGADGPTHHGAFDIAYLRCIPNIIGASPMDAIDFRNLLYTAQHHDRKRTFAIRYPKSNTSRIEPPPPFIQIPIGKGRKISAGKGIAILSIGPIGQEVQQACRQLQDDGIQAAHYDLRFFKPLDTELLHEVFQQFSSVITVEDGSIIGGVGSAVIEFMVEQGYQTTVKRLGLPDSFATHGTIPELHRLYAYDKDAIVDAVKEVYINRSQLTTIL